MSIDLLKNALYQAVKNAIPALTFYTELDDAHTETYPNLRFVEVDSVHLGARVGHEAYTVPTGLPATDPDTGLPNPPFLTFPVIARMRTKLRLQLRDSLGKGPKNVAAYQRLRDQHNAVQRFLVKTRAVAMGPGAAEADSWAELWYQGDRQNHDKAAGVFLWEYEVDVDPWRLLDTSGFQTFRADQITVDVQQGRGAADRILITRVYAQP